MSRKNKKKTSTWMPAEKNGRQLRHVMDIAIQTSKQSLREYGFDSAAIISDWKVIIGERFSSMIFPINLIRGKRGGHGTLVCGLANASYVLEVQMQKDIIMQKVNVYFGSAVIGDIKFRAANTLCNDSSCDTDLSTSSSGRIFVSDEYEKQMMYNIQFIQDEELGELVRELYFRTFTRD